MPARAKPEAKDRVALYDKLIATIPALERKGDANPYTSLNGNMFTLLHEGKLAIRLSEDEREKFLKKYKTALYEAYGAVMREYVAVPDSLLPRTSELKKYLEMSYGLCQDPQAETYHQEAHFVVILSGLGREGPMHFSPLSEPGRRKPKNGSRRPSWPAFGPPFEAAPPRSPRPGLQTPTTLRSARH